MADNYGEKRKPDRTKRHCWTPREECDLIDMWKVPETAKKLEDKLFRAKHAIHEQIASRMRDMGYKDITSSTVATKLKNLRAEIKCVRELFNLNNRDSAQCVNFNGVPYDSASRKRSERHQWVVEQFSWITSYMSNPAQSAAADVSYAATDDVSEEIPYNFETMIKSEIQPNLYHEPRLETTTEAFKNEHVTETASLEMMTVVDTPRTDSFRTSIRPLIRIEKPRSIEGPRITMQQNELHNKVETQPVRTETLRTEMRSETPETRPSQQTSRMSNKRELDNGELNNRELDNEELNKRKLENDELTSNKKLAPDIQDQTDEDFVFGKYIETELKSIKDKRIKATLKHKIQTEIFEAKMKDLDD
ncbi:uncharacterized protein [Antedon mediterranea]|uniref:uncharacterized protein n=1 Tax=Antedon mediterranea TaxID=105859 RepID=UPI003AF712EB